MTEPEWLTCAEPQRMVAYLEDRRLASEWKLRLYVEACREITIMARASMYNSARKLRLYVEACREIAVPGKVKWGFDLSRSADLHDAVLEWSRDMGSYEDGKIPLAMRADLLRDLFGNPFRPYWRAGRGLMRGHVEKGHGFGTHDQIADLADWLTWQDGTIPRMAQQIDDARDFAALPVLADALEDAGCQEEAILRHCREPLHVRGCWCVDLILGRS